MLYASWQAVKSPDKRATEMGHRLKAPAPVQHSKMEAL